METYDDHCLDRERSSSCRILVSPHSIKIQKELDPTFGLLSEKLVKDYLKMFLTYKYPERSFKRRHEPQLSRTRRELVVIPAELAPPEKHSVTVAREAENVASSFTDSTVSRCSITSVETMEESTVFMSGEFDETISKSTPSENEKEVPVNPHAASIPPRFHADEIVVGRLLGRGNFCQVKEVRAILKPKHDSKQISFLLNHVVERSGSYNFAVKRVYPKSALLTEDIQKGMDDLYKESLCLQALAHPNIVKLRAMASQRHEHTADFFLVLDRLYDTLQHRVAQWKRAQWPGRTVIAPRGAKLFLADRLLVAHDMADAIRYLHSRRVIHRDIKPANMAFDRVSALFVYV